MEVIQCLKRHAMIKHSYIWIVLFALLLISCRTRSKLIEATNQLTIHDAALISVLQQSQGLSLKDTIYLYNRFSYDTSRYSQYYDLTNATIQDAFVDTFQTVTGGNNELVKLWDNLREYKFLLDSTLLLGDIQQYVKPKLIYLTTDNLHSIRYSRSRVYFPTFATGYGKDGLVILLKYRNSGGDMGYYYSLQKGPDNTFGVEDEYHTVVDNNTYLVKDWIRTINFDQSLQQYWDNDFMKMAKLYDDAWEKECLKLTGKKCSRTKLIDLIKKNGSQ